MSKNQRKIIYINGKFLAQRLSGVQRCATEIVKALDKLVTDMPYEVILLTPRKTIYQLDLEHIAVKTCGHLGGTLWEQLELPLYANGGFLLNLCNCAPLIKGNQTVILHDVSFMAVPEAYGFCYRLWHMVMSYVLGKRLPLVITDSEFSKRELEKYLHIPSEKISVVYLGVDHMERITPDEGMLTELGREKGSYVLAVSSQSLHKNFRLVLEAAKKLPDKTFLIAGQKNTAVFQSQEITEVPDNVIFTGYVSDCQLAALYKNAACFLFPSLYEGFGLPPLEAMSCGIPVIASNAACLPEVLGEAAMYVDPYNASEVVVTISRITGNEALRGNFIAAGRDQFRKYSWDKGAKQIMERMVGLIGKQ